MLKFFSKNKKGVSESQGFSSEEIAHGVFRVEKKTNYFHKKAVCKDGKLYNTETAIKVIELDKEKVNWFGSYQMRTYFITAKGNWFSCYTLVEAGIREHMKQVGDIDVKVVETDVSYLDLELESIQEVKGKIRFCRYRPLQEIFRGGGRRMNCFLYSIGNDVRSCEKEEYIPRCATGLLKVQNGEVFSKENGEWKKLSMLYAPISDNKDSLPESPIDVASMLINATVTNELPTEKIPLSSLLEQKTWEIPKYNILQLEEIAKHLLLYCETKRKGYKDADSENHKPQPQ